MTAEQEEQSTEPQRGRMRTARFIVGVLILLAMIPTSAIDSFRAMQTMQNAPPRWLPETVPTRANWELFLKIFLDTDILLVSWPGCEVETTEMDDVVDAILELEAEKNKTAEPWFSRVGSGNDAIARMTQPPVNLPMETAISRLKGVLVGPDGKTTCVVVPFTGYGEEFRSFLINDIRQIVHEKAGVPLDEVYFAGPPSDGWHTDQATIESMDRLTFPSWLLAAVLAWLCLRSLVLTLPILVIALIGQGFMLGLVYWFGVPMNAVLIVLPPLVFVLTVSSGIHLSNYYLDIINSNPDIRPEDAADRALEIGGRPCWLAAGTTVIGLSSLSLVHIWPVAYFGMIASIGVLWLLGVLILIMPGAMIWDARLRGRWMASRLPKIKEEKADGRLMGISRWSLSFSSVIVFVFLCGTVATGLGIPKMTTSVNLPRMFSPQSEMRQHSAWLEEHLGPTIGAEIMIHVPDSAMRSVNDEGVDAPDSLKRLQFVRRLHYALWKNSEEHGLISAHTFLPTVNSKRLWQATATRAALRQQIEDPDSQLHRLGYVAEYEGEQYWRITLRMPAREDISYQDEMTKVRELLKPVFEEYGEGATAIYTGAVPISGDAQILLLKDLFRSFLTTFAIVAIVMAIVLRDLIGGLLSMFPNLFPTLTLFGAMGWLKIPLDIGTVMTASVALGIAVDGTLHMLQRYRYHDQQGASSKVAALESLRQCGPAMWQTTVVCGLSLLVYAYTDFVPSQRFAVMMFGLLVAALIGDAIILPAMMASPFGRWFRRKQARSTG